MSAPDDRHPESGDASHFDFDDLVLDEEFVRSARINEASATARVEKKREQQVRRSSRFPRPFLRQTKRGLQGWTRNRPDDRRARPAPEAPKVREWTAAQWVAVVVVVALAAVFVWSLSRSGSKAQTAATSGASSIATPSGADPVGTCKGIQSTGDHVASISVSCSAQHSVEITGYVTVAAQPTSTAAQTMVASLCQRSAIAYIGGELPTGVDSGFLPISAAQWSAGDRSIACTIYQGDSAGSLVPRTGSLAHTA